jgi:alkane 1-monooxygenase
LTQTAAKTAASQSGQSVDDHFPVARFALVFGIAGMPVLCAIGASYGLSWLAVLPFLMVHLAIPLLDAVIKPDTSSAFSRQQVQHRWLARSAFDWPLLCLPIWLACLFSTLWFTQSLSGGLWLICIVGLGAVGGILAINPAHELIHRRSRLQRIAGGILLSAVSYGAFKIEHVRGHHRWVGTDKDKASAKRGQNVYGFAPASIVNTFIGAFQIEQRRLVASQLPWFKNEFLHWSAVSVLLSVLVYFMAGWQAVAGFYIASITAIIELELINYIEHYGLRRKFNSAGEPETVTEIHSWNCSTWVVNAYLFNLQRHADHHAHPGREYLALRDLPNAPRLPLGYGSMVLIALLPPLWFKVMHPILDSLPTSQDQPQSPD